MMICITSSQKGTHLCPHPHVLPLPPPPHPQERHPGERALIMSQMDVALARNKKVRACGWLWQFLWQCLRL